MGTLFRVEKNAQNVFRHPSRGISLLIGPGENCLISFPVRLLISETVLGFGGRFQNSFVRRSPGMISPRHSNLESYYEAIFPFQSFQSAPLYRRTPRRFIIIIIIGGQFSKTLLRLERHVQCAQSPCIMLNLPLRMAAPQQSISLFNGLRKQKLTNAFNYCLQQHYH